MKGARSRGRRPSRRLKPSPSRSHRREGQPMLSTVLLVASTLQPQQAPMPIKDGQVIQLWNGAAPGALGTEDADVPSITVFLPRTMTASTPAVVVCPGGGYQN